MSAFIVEDRTINVIVSALFSPVVPDSESKRRLLAQHEDPELLAQTLFAMNVEAVNARDGVDANSMPLRIRRTWEQPSRIQALKSLHCWLYQCAEGKVPNYPLYKQLRTISREMAVTIVCELPEYDKARWA